MRNLIALVMVLLLSAIVPADAQQSEPEGATSMVLRKVTPVLLTENVKACVMFWSEFGLKATMTVPDENELMFAIVTNGEVELMYQTFESALADNASAVEGINRAIIYIEVDALDPILQLAAKYEVVKPEHTTAYGAREIYIRDPAGNLVGFAEQGETGE